MTKQATGVKLSPVEQICIVVKDMDQAIDHYTRVFGWGPFQTHDMKMEGFTYRGRKGNCRIKVAFFQSGPVEIELVQVLEGDSVFSEFLREKGEGLQHLRFRVDDLDSTLAELAKEGISPVFHHRLAEHGVAFALVDSDRIGGVMFELFEMKGNALKKLKEVAKP